MKMKSKSISKNKIESDVPFLCNFCGHESYTCQNNGIFLHCDECGNPLCACNHELDYLVRNEQAKHRLAARGLLGEL